MAQMIESIFRYPPCVKSNLPETVKYNSQLSVGSDTQHDDHHSVDLEHASPSTVATHGELGDSPLKHNTGLNTPLDVRNKKLQKLLSAKWDYCPTSNVSFMKFLVGDDIAGYLVGRGGLGIEEFQRRHGPGVKLMVSRLNEKFPGTGDRVVQLVGVHDRVLAALGEITDVVFNRAAHKAGDVELSTGRSVAKPKVDFKFVVPKSAAGLIIGSKGYVAGLVKKETGSIIYMTHNGDLFHYRSQAFYLQERICQIIGTREQVAKSARIIGSLYQSDTSLNKFQCLAYVPAPPPPVEGIYMRKVSERYCPQKKTAEVFQVYQDRKSPKSVLTECSKSDSSIHSFGSPSCYCGESTELSEMHPGFSETSIRNTNSPSGHDSSCIDNDRFISTDLTQLLSIVEAAEPHQLIESDIKISTEISEDLALYLVSNSRRIQMIEKTTTTSIGISTFREEASGGGRRWTMEIGGNLLGVCLALATCQTSVK